VLLGSSAKRAKGVDLNSFPPPGNEGQEVFAQALQIGALPVLNTLLFQNSPRQVAADWLFALATLEDAGAASATGSDAEQAADRTAMDTVFAQMG
jgi:hypothetical protein